MRLWRNNVAGMLLLIVAERSLSSSPAALSPHEMLEIIRAHVLEQVRIGGNYMCVQTADRHYFRPEESARPGCDNPLKHPDKTTEVLSDRLRLAVAVSENQEIYSWYGQPHFHSGTIDELITNGPITTGGFGGFLRNIFLTAGIEFTYMGHFELNGVPVDSFDYNVPLARSNYAITSRHGPVAVAFRGSFSANTNTLELTKLIVEVPRGPPDSTVCYARSAIDYQIAPISGNDVLIPSHFDFKLNDVDHTLTDTQFDYRTCHAFTGESSISFVISDPANSGALNAQPIAKGPLPANLYISINLRTPIDDRNSYTGDPVEGLLLHRLKLHSGEVIPKGAVVSGIITQLEFYRKPSPYYMLNILFNKIVDGNVTYGMRATYIAPSESSMPTPQLRGRGNRGGVIVSQPLSGHDSMVETGSHFHLNSGYRSEWITRSTESAKSDGNE